MNYKLSKRNPNKENKFWTYGNFKKNKWGNYQASFKVSALQELIDQADGEWVNLSAFAEEEPAQQKQNDPF